MKSSRHGRAKSKQRLPSQALGGHERLSDLVHVIQELSLTRDLPGIQCVVRSAARRILGADGATFVLRDGQQCFYADEDAIEPLWKGRRFPLSACISGWTMLHREPAVIEDIYQDPRIPADAYRQTFVKSLAMVPIRRLDPIGAIGVYWADRRVPADGELGLLQSLADSTAVAMESVTLLEQLEHRVRQRTQELEGAYREIHELALQDDLTGLRNRRGFYLLGDQQRRLASRSGRMSCIVFADVDGLKKVNDHLGHEAGDQLLRRVAQVLRSTFRDCDVVARLGGDEFCVLAVDCGCHPRRIRERLERNLAAFNANTATSPFPLSLSIGVQPCVADDPASLEQLVNRADKAMYAHKRRRFTAFG